MSLPTWRASTIQASRLTSESNAEKATSIIASIINYDLDENDRRKRRGLYGLDDTYLVIVNSTVMSDCEAQAYSR